uniref:Protein kinase domain-containing protein n=1 Tax=Sphenodon punctatus TaxID=8508 RepID=A0A8D0GC97_SPHPU
MSWCFVLQCVAQPLLSSPIPLRGWHLMPISLSLVSPPPVDRWKKLHSVPLLGIPNCIGFGLHGSHYRFLVFSDLGRSLQSILDDGTNLLTEKAAFQIAIRLVDALEYIHGNEYVHGDITAENIYVNPADLAEVTLAGYSYAFRYSPGGEHVAYREGSRTPHEGTIEFISLDSHKGVGLSCRSDLESLGYCLVKWLCGFLPWTEELGDGRPVAWHNPAARIYMHIKLKINNL